MHSACEFYSGHAHKDSPTRKWWSLLSTADTCSSSTNVGKRVSPVRAVIPARPFCKGDTENVKHTSLSAYFNILKNTFVPKNPGQKHAENPQLKPQTTVERQHLRKNKAVHASGPSGAHAEVRCWKLKWVNELLHSRDNGCPTSKMCPELPKSFGTLAQSFTDKKILKLQMNCN